MICNRFKVWQGSFCLIVAASLIGCGSSNTQGTTTAVPAQTTAVPGAGMTPGKPGMPGMPGMPAGQASAPGAGHMNPAHMQAMMKPGQAGSPTNSGGSSASPNSQYMAQMAANMPNPNANSSGGSSNSPSSPNMAAHMTPGLPPGANSNSSASMDPSKMLAHTGPGASSTPNGAAGMPPGGMATPPGMAPAPGGQGAPPGMSAPGGPNGSSGPGGASGQNAAAQMRGANGQLGSMPGQPGGGGSPAGNLTPGSIEDILYRFCVAIADGDTAAAGEFVSPKAKGLIGQIRDGELSEEKLEEVTNAISPVTELQPNPSQTNTKRSLRNKKNQVITFTVKKDKDDEYKITELSISKPKKGGQSGQGGQGGQGSF